MESAISRQAAFFWRLITLLLKFARIMCDRALYSSTSNKHSSSVKFAFLSFDSIISTDLVCFTSKPKKVYRKKKCYAVINW